MRNPSQSEKIISSELSKCVQKTIEHAEAVVIVASCGQDNGEAGMIWNYRGNRHAVLGLLESLRDRMLRAPIVVDNMDDDEWVNEQELE